VAFSAIGDGLASISSAAGGVFSVTMVVGAFSVGPEGWSVFASVSAVGDFLFAGSC